MTVELPFEEKLRALVRAAEAGYFADVAQTWVPGTVSKLNAKAGAFLGEVVNDRIRFVRAARGWSRG